MSPRATSTGLLRKSEGMAYTYIISPRDKRVEHRTTPRHSLKKDKSNRNLCKAPSGKTTYLCIVNH